MCVASFGLHKFSTTFWHRLNQIAYLIYWGMSSNACWVHSANSSRSFGGSCYLNRRLSIFHRCIIGFISRLLAGTKIKIFFKKMLNDSCSMWPCIVLLKNKMMTVLLGKRDDNRLDNFINVEPTCSSSNT